MSKITVQHQNILRLVQRSHVLEDGSYHVSKAIMPLLKDFPAELAAITHSEDGSGFIKLTAYGNESLHFMNNLEVRA